MMTGRTQEIFVSYAREDLERVRPLIRAFAKHDCRVSWDQEFRTGKTWTEAIQDAIRRSPCVIVVWSKHSVRSEWVVEEAMEAKEQTKQIFPVMLDDVTPPFGFRRLQAANLVDWDGDEAAESFSRLLNDVLQLLHECRAARRESPQANGRTMVSGESAGALDVLEAADRLGRSSAGVDVAGDDRWAALGVYLAWMSEPLRGARARIRREIEGRGHTVVPSTDSPPSESAMEDEVRRQIKQSDLSIHALGAQFQPLPGDANHSLDQLQLEISAERSRDDPGFSRFIWVTSPGASDDERQRDLVDAVLHMQLDKRDELIETSIEDLLDLVVERLRMMQRTIS